MNYEHKLALLEKLSEKLGDRKSITIDAIQKFLKAEKVEADIEYEEISDYLAASGVTVIGESAKITPDNPMAMYFHDIGDVEILDKEKELKIAYNMRENKRKLQNLLPILTLSIKKFLLLGVQLEKGEIGIDEFTISSFRPDDITPTEHRTDVIMKMARIEGMYRKLETFIKSSKKASVGVRTYWDKKSIILSEIREEIDAINPSLKIIETILPIFDRLYEYWKDKENKLDEFLKLAGVSREDAEKLFNLNQSKKKGGKTGKEAVSKLNKLISKLNLGEKTVSGIIKEYGKYNRVRTRIKDISLVPLPVLFKQIEQIPELVNNYESAREKLVKANVRLVVNVARNYMNQGVDFLDLIQEGNHALLRAIERFDPDKKFKVATYAIWWIRQAMIQSIAEQSQVIRLPAYLIQWARKYSRIYHELSQKLGREPTTKEISEELDVDEREVDATLRKLQSHISLDKTLGKDPNASGRTLGEIIEDEDSESPSLLATLAVLQKEIQRILSTLSPREAEVISLRFGLEDNYPRTLEEIGKKFNLSRERIRQIETRALSKLRHPSRLKVLETFLKE